MSGHALLSRAAVAAGVLLVLVIGSAPPALGDAPPAPLATTATASPTASDSDVKPVDEPTDDGTDPAPDQTGTWVAIGGAAALALVAGLVTALRRR